MQRCIVAPLKTPLSIKARALRYLARREHSRLELERKLAATLPPDESVEGSGDSGDSEKARADEIRRALDELAAHGLLSDERAAESLLAAQAPRMGQRRLRQAMLAKGLAPELVATTLQASRATEYERARDLWQRRFGRAPADATECARQMRFLAGRGFDGEIVRRLVRLEGRPAGDTEQQAEQQAEQQPAGPRWRAGILPGARRRR